MHSTLATLMVAHDAAEVGDEALRVRMLDELVEVRHLRFVFAREIYRAIGQRAREANYARRWGQDLLAQDWLRWNNLATSTRREVIAPGIVRLRAGAEVKAGDFVSVDNNGCVVPYEAGLPIGAVMEGVRADGTVQVQMPRIVANTPVEPSEFGLQVDAFFGGEMP